MIATLRLEAIGDNHVGRGGMAMRPFRHVLKNMRRIPSEQREAVLTPNRRPWVAQITGRDARHGLARTFLNHLKDYKDANGTGSRGVYLTYVLRDGFLYEVRELLSWSRERRYFCRVAAGQIVEMTAEEVARYLDASTSPIQDIINQAKRGTP